MYNLSIVIKYELPLFNVRYIRIINKHLISHWGFASNVYPVIYLSTFLCAAFAGKPSRIFYVFCWASVFFCLPTSVTNHGNTHSSTHSSKYRNIYSFATLSESTVFKLLSAAVVPSSILGKTVTVYLASESTADANYAVDRADAKTLKKSELPGNKSEMLKIKQLAVISCEPVCHLKLI